jgi:peptidoglycan/xylan/chitin deacetylase (PgdA/CDA1 family)
MMNPFSKGRSMLRRLGDRWRQGAFVLMYHRVDTNAEDPFDIRVTPGHFEDQLAMLRERWRVVPMADLAAAMRDGESVEGCVAITFDDGYEDNLRVALPALEREGLPATVFVVSEDLGAEFWWDRMTRLWLTRRGAAPTPEFRRLHRHLRGLNVPARTEALEEIAAEPALAAVVEPTPARSVTPDELARLAAHPLIEIGAHTRTHPCLTDLDAEAQMEEIAGSRASLEAVTGGPVEGVSYPFGAYDRHSIAAARAAGFAYACAALAGVCTTSTPAFEIPRFTVCDWTGEELDRRLQERSPGSAAAGSAYAGAKTDGPAGTGEPYEGVHAGARVAGAAWPAAEDEPAT